MRDVFILGAGFSKAINDAMPTMKELSEEVIARLEKSPFPIQDTLYALGNDVELWMTYLSQEQPWLMEEHHYRNLALAREMRRHIRDVMVECTKSSMSSPTPEWLTCLINEWASRRAIVLTLNYDTLVERATRAISVGDHRGVLAESMYPLYFSDIQSRSGVPRLVDLRIETFTYLNLHGSTNLYYSGRSDFFGETIFMSKVPAWGTNDSGYESQSELISNDKEVLIIPPVTDKLTYFNNETIRRLWKDASAALWAAPRVFVIGYSLPPEDLGMKFFLQHSQPSEGTSVYIVDENAAVVERYEEVLPKLKVQHQFAGRAGVVSDFVSEYSALPPT